MTQTEDKAEKPKPAAPSTVTVVVAKGAGVFVEGKDPKGMGIKKREGETIVMSKAKAKKLLKLGVVELKDD